jgi:hypothetical protein
MCVCVQRHQIYDAVGLKDAARAAKRAELQLTQHGRPATATVSTPLQQQQVTQLTILYTRQYRVCSSCHSQ